MVTPPLLPPPWTHDLVGVFCGCGQIDYSYIMWARGEEEGQQWGTSPQLGQLLEYADQREEAYYLRHQACKRMPRHLKVSGHGVT